MKVKEIHKQGGETFQRIEIGLEDKNHATAQSISIHFSRVETGIHVVHKIKVDTYMKAEIYIVKAFSKTAESKQLN